MAAHAYVDRGTGDVLSEALYADPLVAYLYGEVRERSPELFRAATGRRLSRLLGWVNFDSPLAASLVGSRRFLADAGIDLSECLADPASWRTPRQLFERQIRYWHCRPLADAPGQVASPADCRLVVGSLDATAGLFLKGKFFALAELLGGREPWVETFARGDFAVCRLAPADYHYNHTPVAGRVVDVYEVAGDYHACSPAAVIELATPLSKNRRVVTIFETDVPGGSGVGRVAMVEVVALMIGRIEQGYCAHRYDDPRPVEAGLWVEKGCPKSLYRPGSSTDVLLFEPGRVRFDADLVASQRRADVGSRYSLAFGQPLVESAVRVRSGIARRA